MKSTICVNIPASLMKDYFIAVRDRFDAAQNIVSAICAIKTFPQTTQLPEYGLVLSICHFKRLFIINGNSIVSLAFPFHLTCNEESILDFRCTTGLELDNLTLANLKTLLNGMKNLGFWDFVSIENSSDLGATGTLDLLETSLWDALRSIISEDDGYLRYDYDDSERTDEIIHPASHIDLNYSNAASLKLGFRQKIGMVTLVEMLDKKERCYFIES
jgi:hypothetical protein